MKKAWIGIVAVTFCFSFFAGAQRRALIPPTGVTPIKAVPYSPIPYPNIGVAEVQHPENYSRIVAISDVHGMWQNLYRLLVTAHLIDANLHWLGGKTLVIVIGDSIDKGPDSIYVLDFWMNLTLQARAVGGDVIHTLGNHEAEFLADPTNPKAQVFLDELKKKNIPLEQVTNPAFPRGAFLRQMPMAARVGRFLFVHAGLYPEMEFPVFVSQAHTLISAGGYGSPFVTGADSALEAKDWWKNTRTRLALEATLQNNGIYGVVFGLMPDALGITNDVGQADNEKLIKTDSGMAPEAGSNPGHFVVFMQPAQLNQMQPPQALSMGVGGVVHSLVP